MIALGAKDLNAPKVHKVQMKVQMRRRSVRLNSWIDESLNKTRGHLMSNIGKDIDNTETLNLFLALGMKLYWNIKEQTKEFADFGQNVGELLDSAKGNRFEQFTKQIPTGTLKSVA